MNQLYSPDLVPPGVEILWSNEDQNDPERYIIGADFHTAELRLNQAVDLSPHPPLEAPQAEQIFLMSLGMTRQEQADHLGITSVNTVDTNIRGAQRRLGAKGHQTIGRLFRTGVVEVTEPLMPTERPSEETYRLVDILRKYPTLIEAHRKETGHIKNILGKTAAQYGLRGLYDFMTWAHAAKILDSSPPKFVEPVEDKPTVGPFIWHQTAEGFVVKVFDEAQSCAELEFEGRYRKTAWLRAIALGDGRIAVRNFLDTPSGRIHLSQAELGALAVTTLGGVKGDIKRLGIDNPKAVQYGLYEKLGVPRILPPYAPIRASVRSFEQKVMTCEAPPTTMAMRDEERRYLNSLAHFDSHAHAAGMLGTTSGSLRTQLSALATRSSFPGLAGVHLMMYAADAYASRVLN